MQTISQGASTWTVTDKGIKISGLTTAQILALSMVAGDAGTERYNTDTGTMWLWTGTKWKGETARTGLTLAADWTGVLEYKRLDNDVVIFRTDSLQRINTTYLINETIATMPVGFRPPSPGFKYSAGLKELGSVPTFTPLLIYSNGSVQIYENIIAGTFLSFDTMYYSLN